MIKKPVFTPEELNSNIAYGMTTENNISKDELDSIQWLCEKSMNDDIKIDNLKNEVRESNVGIAHLKNQLKQAKEKLAEKEKELSIRTFEAEMNGITITKMRESKNQGKTDLVEEIKAFCEKNKDSNEYDYVVAYESDDPDFYSDSLPYLKDFLNEKISQLKGEKK